MIDIHLSAEDLAQTRFAFSALWETVASYQVLTYPEKYPLHLPWIREATEALNGLDMSPVDALMAPWGRVDFLTPPPTTPLPDFEAELQRLLETPFGIIQQDVRNILENPKGIYKYSVDGSSFEPYLQDPQEMLERLTETLWAYWERIMARHWPRLHTVLEADVMYRARTFALEGPEKVFNELHPNLRYHNRTLELSFHTREQKVHLNLSGQGLLLIPSVFCGCSLKFDPPWQETIQYGARGTAGLWSPEPPATGEALEKLLGQNRARLLKHLITPSTTQELAYMFKVTPSAVSQNLGWLREVGLVATQRQGKHVYYKLSPIGEGMLEAYGELEAPLALAG